MVSTGRPPGLYILSTHPYRGPGAAGPVTGGSRGFCGGPADPSGVYPTSLGKGLKVGVTPHPLYLLLISTYCLSALCIVYSPKLPILITPLSRSFAGTMLVFLVSLRVADQCTQASPYAVSLRTTSFRQRRSATSRRIVLFSTLACTVAAYKHRHAMNITPDSCGPTHLSSVTRPTAKYAVTR